MSRIATGIRFTDRQNNKGYGYLAIFADGDVKRHTTDFPKTHCVRVRLTSHWWWQQYPIIPGAEKRGCLNKVWHQYDHFIYEWFKSEAEAVREVRKAASMTIGSTGGGLKKNDPLNQEFCDLPYYDSIEVVEPKVVWAAPETADSLASLNDPRIKVYTPAMVAQALSTLVARPTCGGEVSQ